MKEVKTLLKDINSMEPLKASENRSTFETRVGNFSNYSLGASMFFFVILCVLALSVYVTKNTMEIVASLGMLSAFLSMLLAILSMLSPVIILLRFFRRAKEIYHKDFMNEIEHDERNITVISSYPVEVVEHAGRWLDTKLNRMERRIGHIFGPNAAAFAIVALILKIVEGMGGVEFVLKIFKGGVEIGGFGDWLYAMIFGSVLGVSLGSLWLRSFIVRYQYQSDLVAMCIDREKSRTFSKGDVA